MHLHDRGTRTHMETAIAGTRHDNTVEGYRPVYYSMKDV